MAQGFNNLRDSIKKGRQGAQLTAFKEWRAEGRPATATAPVQPPRGDTVRKALLPFYFGSSDFTNYAIVDISGRSFSSLVAVGLTEAKLCLNDVPETPATGTTYELVLGLEPAKAIIFKPGTGSTSTKSGITGRVYKKRIGTSYTLPFGKRDLAGRRDQRGMRGIILAGVLPGCSVSFKEEKYVP
jgi:hypothetical protein